MKTFDLLKYLLFFYAVLVFSSGCVATKQEISDEELDNGSISEMYVIDEDEKEGNEVVTAQLDDKQIPEKIKISEFVLGPGDEIEINVYRNPDLANKYLIPPDGLISFPLLGELRAAGIGITELRKTITAGLSNFLVEPYVSIGVVNIRSQKVYVLGEVEKPGVFQINSPIDMIEAVSMAGGLTTNAKASSLLLIRGDLENPYLKTVNLKKTLKEGDLSENMTLTGGDIIYVPTTYIASADRFFSHLKNIIAPIVLLESGIVMGPQVSDVLRGERPEAISGTIDINPTSITIEPIVP